jgi:lipopolysaccharide transport system ATP-binding protein
MSNIILTANNISKQYRLGLVGTGTLSHDLNRWWYKVRGKEDPYLKVGAVNDRSQSAKENYVWALKDINFEVKQGEVLGIIGKNGAGKSTLLKLLSRVTLPTTGEIKTKGRIASLLEVGTGFHPELTGRENIFLNGAILGMTKAEIKSKEEEIIAFSGCEMYIDTPVKRYSSGMRVRLAFAVAAHLEPDILVIDEVLAVGDAEFQKKALGKMKDISGSGGRTVLFVSHNMAAVKSLCTRAMVLEHGKVAFEGGTDESVGFYLSNSKKLLTQSLQTRKDRTGKGNAMFNNFLIESASAQNIYQLLLGEEYQFNLSILSKLELKRVAIRIMFLDNDQNVRFLCNNLFQDDYYDLKEGENNFKLTIPKFPLPKNNYNIQLSLFSENGLEDDIENAHEISVVGGDFYGSGKEQISNKGVLIDYSYEVV